MNRPTRFATPALLRWISRWIWILGSAFWLSLQFLPVAQAQPVGAPEAPPPVVLAAIQSAVTALVEATDSDGGYRRAQDVVAGASKNQRLAQAWREWRVAMLTSDPGALQTRLLLQDVEVEEFKRQRAAGGGASAAATARVKVHLAVACGSPTQPVEQWPADPWQGEFILTRAGAEGAQWQFNGSPDTAVDMAPDQDAAGNDEAPIPVPLADSVIADGPIIELSERGGNRLEQAIEVLRHPAAMLRTTLLRTDRQSLSLLTSAVARYAAKTGHYPPIDYAAALLENEPIETRPALRDALGIAGTKRTWQMNPALPERALLPAPVPEEDNPEEGNQVKVLPVEVPLFWDGSAEQPFFRFAGQAMIAFTNGQVALRRAQDLQAGYPRQAVPPPRK